MGSMRILASIIGADFKERTRNYGFMVVSVLTMFCAYLFVPPLGSTFAVVEISGFRGVYNSAWVGATVAMSTVTVLFLFGFTLVKNAIDRDRQTKVGQIIAATPISKAIYLSSKFLSNLLVLSSLMIMALAISVGMQLLRREVLTLGLLDLLYPFLVVVFPCITIVAALAVFFESVTMLSGGVGNVIYFFLWGVLLKYESSTAFSLGKYGISFHSLMGAEIYKQSMREGFMSLFPDSKAIVAEGLMLMNEPLKVFVWEGVNWTLAIMAGRLPWLLLAGLIVLAGTILFKGFDVTVAGNKGGLFKKLLSRFTKPDLPAQIAEMAEFNARDLTPVTYKYSFMNMVVAELRLTLCEQKWWWYLVQLALVFQCVMVPLAATKSIFGPLAWCWPLLIWSSLGIREARNHTDQIVFSCPYPLRRQLPAMWFSGFIITMLTGSGMLLKLLMAGEMKWVLAWLVGALFIPTLAITLGIWTRTSKTFEVIYLVMIFTGVLNGIEIMDFMGAVEGSLEMGMPLIYFAVTIGLAAMAAYGRKSQVQ